ncbi:MAG: bifunctional metallophosphatase/5'-nucleotidase [Mariniphaga sp.]|nr:bifunctional metallophosphatase/5'-nucleotidase [Mariniphaga sp.]
MKTIIKILVLFLIVFVSCSKNDNPQTKVKQLTIFFVNDVHGQIDNFSKIKHIIDLEKQKTNVIIASSGDLFSGNPIVDNSVEKGYPMVDLMNRLEFDIAVLGNHEFDYGIDILKQRNEQANFDWICANVNSGNTSMPQPEAYKTIEKEDLKITFLGLVETNGKQNGTIPSAHPWKMEGLTFERPENVIDQYSNIKSLEGSDLYIALSHLGYGGSGKILGDVTLAEQYPWFDLIIGGHSHQIINTTINNIPIFQSGSYLHNLGKIELTIKNKKIKSYNFELIDLDKYQEFDPEIKTIIDEYMNYPI